MVFPHPWREVGWALGSVAAVLGIGLLYGAGWLLPGTGPLRLPFEALNQLVIFSPMLVLLAVRRLPLITAWLPARRIWLRVGSGLRIALLATLLFSLARTGSAPWPAIVLRVYHPRNVAFAIQVLLEDVTIAILFVRFAAAVGLRGTIPVVATLFAAAHIPAMLQGGATWPELTRLVLDAGPGVGILSVVRRSGDVWWFWMVHFAMDMMQFHAVPPAAP